MGILNPKNIPPIISGYGCPSTTEEFLKQWNKELKKLERKKRKKKLKRIFNGK